MELELKKAAMDVKQMSEFQLETTSAQVRLHGTNLWEKGAMSAVDTIFNKGCVLVIYGAR